MSLFRRDAGLVHRFEPARNLSRLRSLSVQVERADLRFEALWEALPDGAALVMREGGIIARVNRHFELVLGYGPGELVGRCVDDLVPDSVRATHPGLRARFFEDLKPLRLGVRGPIHARRKDGTLIKVLVSIGPYGRDAAVAVMLEWPYG